VSKHLPLCCLQCGVSKRDDVMHKTESDYSGLAPKGAQSGAMTWRSGQRRVYGLLLFNATSTKPEQ
jgi:hypothetical protein